MTRQAAQDPGFGFVAGDHACAFYSGRQGAFDDIVADYVTTGLQASSRVFCAVDRPSDLLSRVPLPLSRDDQSILVRTEDQAYLPGGQFTKEAFIRNVTAQIGAACDLGYESFRAVGDESFIVRNHVDINEWFAAESALNNIDPEFPHFFFCLYDLDLFDASTVTNALRTHPRVYVNGILIDNPHYQPER